MKQFIGVEKQCQRCDATEEFRQTVAPNELESAKRELSFQYVAWFPVSVGQRKYELCPQCIDAFHDWVQLAKKANAQKPEKPECYVWPILGGHTVGNNVATVIEGQLDVNREDIKPTATLMDDLGADSMALVELSLALEEKFEITIPDDVLKVEKRIAESVTVQDVIDYVERKLKEKP